MLVWLMSIAVHLEGECIKWANERMFWDDYSNSHVCAKCSICIWVALMFHGRPLYSSPDRQIYVISSWHHAMEMLPGIVHGWSGSVWPVHSHQKGSSCDVFIGDRLKISVIWDFLTPMWCTFQRMELLRCIQNQCITGRTMVTADFISIMLSSQIYQKFHKTVIHISIMTENHMIHRMN